MIFGQIILEEENKNKLTLDLQNPLFGLAYKIAGVLHSNMEYVQTDISLPEAAETDQRITDYLKESEIRTSHFGIYSRNIEDVKAKIDYKYGLNIFTHWVVKTIEEDRGYDCIESVYRQNA